MSRDNFDRIIRGLADAAESVKDLEQVQEFGGSFSLPRVEVKITRSRSGADIARMMRQVDELAIVYIREALESALDAAMQSNIWEGGSDIVDTGELMNSLSVTIQGNKVTMTYTADYAALVHYGGYIAPYGNKSIDKVYIPGRPWVDSVVNGYAGGDPIDFRAIYERAFKQVF